MQKNIRVAILDDHQSAIDGYIYRLSTNPDIQVVGSANYGSELDDLVMDGNVDVLLLDVAVPNSAEDANPFPVLSVIPRLRKKFPSMAVLISSMHGERPLVRAALDAGANGYILKDDREASLQLAEIISIMSTGGIYLSRQLRNLFTRPGPMDLPEKLSSRELEVLSISAAYPEISTVELAKRMEIAPSTVRNLLSRAYRRLHVGNRAAAISRARQLGLITPYPPEGRRS